MRRVALMVLLSIPAAWAADNRAPFVSKPASEYPGHRTLDKITIAAAPFVTESQQASAFGKADLVKYGFLPILLVIENNTGKTIRLDLKAEFVDAQNKHLESTPPGDLVLFNGTHKRGWNPPMATPIPLPGRSKKGPLNTWEIEGRAFSVKLLPNGERASGFLYFETPNKPGSRLYLTGIKDAASGKDFFYFEVPFENEK